MASTPANPLHEPTFDASAWLAGWAEHGGIVFLVEDRLYLRRPTLLDPISTQLLGRMCAEVLLARGAPAIVEHLTRLREGNLDRSNSRASARTDR